MTVISGAAGGATVAGDRDAMLREQANRLEAVFFNQMMQAMRAASPEGGLLQASQGEKLFTGMLDEHIAGLAAGGSDRGIGAALYRQLAARMNAAEGNQAHHGGGADAIVDR